MADLAARWNADANCVSQYRLRLIAADMVHSPGHGYVDYTLPYLRDCLREHAASTGLRSFTTSGHTDPWPRPRQFR